MPVDSHPLAGRAQVLATVTLVPDIGWWWCAMVQCGELGSAVTDTGSEAFRAGRASRATSRAGRILRFIRLVRLVRIVKLYKHVRKQEAVLEVRTRTRTRTPPRRTGRPLHNGASVSRASLPQVLRLKTFSAEELRAKFKAIDKDRNNVLDKTEVEMLFEDAFISTGQAAPPGAAAEFMQRLDKNGDGTLRALARTPLRVTLTPPRGAPRAPTQATSTTRSSRTS